MRPFAANASGLATSTMRMDLSRGVVTHTSCVAATYANPSGMESILMQPSFLSATQTLESPRLPT